MLTHSLRRGLAAGLVAGLLAGVFAFAFGEPALRDAIALEAAAVPADAPAEPPLVDRSTQEALLPIATGIVGTALGGLFGLAWAFARPRLSGRSDWRATRALALVAWTGVVLLPTVLVPANPPGVGDPGTVGARTAAYLVTVAGGLAVGGALVWLGQRLRGRGVPEARRAAALVATGAAGVGVVALAVPDLGVAADVPADLLWSFRLATFGTQTVLWLGLAVVFGLLVERGDRAGGPDRASGAEART
jgi:hypothetical protein